MVETFIERREPKKAKENHAKMGEGNNLAKDSICYKAVTSNELKQIDLHTLERIC